MSASSTARQFELNFSQEAVASDPQSGRLSGTAEILRMPRFPSFNYPPTLENAASRNAARLNAAAINPADHTRLLEERKALLAKAFGSTLSASEENRLAYLKWSLDRVDDARYGLDLERLESMVAQYETFQKDIEGFLEELHRMQKAPRR
jgi:hypothetical protein